MKNTLLLHEWIAIVVILCMMAILTFVTSIRNHTVVEVPFFKVQDVEVYVKGAVESPKKVIVPKGSTWNEVISQVDLSPNADVGAMKLSKKVREGQVIVVPEKEKIVVFLEGDLAERRSIVLPKGSRVEDLREILKLDERVTIKKRWKNRKLKEGEIIEIVQSAEGNPREKNKE